MFVYVFIFTFTKRFVDGDICFSCMLIWNIIGILFTSKKCKWSNKIKEKHHNHKFLSKTEDNIKFALTVIKKRKKKKKK